MIILMLSGLAVWSPAIRASAATTVSLTDAPFSAVADDGKDDAPALQKALERLIAEGGGVLHIPSGQYDFDSRVSVHGSFSRLTIRGMGASITRLHSRNGEGVLKIEAGNGDAEIGIMDLDIVPTRADAGTALELTKPFTEPDEVPYNLLLTNIEFRPNNNETDYFTRVIVAGGWKPLIDNINSSGLYGPKFNTFEGKRKKYRAESILTLKPSYKPRVRYCNLWAATHGIVIELTDAHEEPTLDGAVSVENAHGIRITKTGDRPLSSPVVIVGCHWNNAFSGLVMEHVDRFRLVQNCLYGAWDVEPDYRDIRLVDCADGELMANSFWFGVRQRPLIYIEDDCRDILIRDSYFGRGCSRTPVVIEEGAQNIEVTRSVYGTVYAMDEDDTFGLWEMEDVENGRALDKDLLQPGRDNDLNLAGAVPAPGSEKLKLGGALHFPDSTSRAKSTLAWDGANGVRIHAHVRIDRRAERQALLTVPGVFALELHFDRLCLIFKDGRGDRQVLQVRDVAPGRRWIPVFAEVDPETGRAVLEAGGLGGDRRFADTLRLLRRQAPLIMGATEECGGFSGALDQVWIQRR
ncbi:hypothetical protein [Kiritimatiella glycovorans]|nr:hypothetical protein [Kiritimatiella glycovorans]